MEEFKKLSALAVSLKISNIDTDQIIPARFLRSPRNINHGQFLFHDFRREPNGNLRNTFPLNNKNNHGAEILVADSNFGCGSSRESAVFALYDAGFKCVIAPSFSDIFYSNCTKNGLLPIALDRNKIELIWDTLETANSAQIEVDLKNQIIHLPNGTTLDFLIDPFVRQTLLEGLDDIDLTLRQQTSIESHEAEIAKTMPWIDSF